MTGSQHACPACLTPTNHPGLCHHCTSQWRDALHAVPLAMQALWLKAARQTHTQHGGHASHAAAPQPVDWTAEDQMQELADLLNWIATLADQHQATETRWPRLLNSVLAHLREIANTDQAATAMRSTINALAKTWRMTDPVDDTKAVGDCPQCHRPLFAQDGQEHVTCKACHSQWDAQWLRDRRAARIAQTLAANTITGTPQQIARWTTAATGTRTTGHQVSMWIHRGKLQATRTPDGRQWQTTMQALIDAIQDRRKNQ